MKKTNCSNPNCKLSATKSHPKEDKGLCDIHYTEVVTAIKDSSRMILLTYNNSN